MPRSVMQHSFATVTVAKIPRSSFNRSSGLKTTFDADFLVPIYLDEVLPNDTFNMNCSAVIRLNSPTLHPLMDNMTCDVHWFFCPTRFLWPNWEKMHGAQEDPGDTIAYTTPILANNVLLTEHDIWDYMGLPNTTVAKVDINALPLRAYNKIWADWYRDENLQDSPALNTGNGPDAAADYTLLKRGKRYDYFTSALPSLQKGTAVSLPLGDTILDVQSAGGNADTLGYYDSTAGDHVRMPAAGVWLEGSADTTTAEANKFYVDIADSIGPTLNDFRISIATQRLLERDARSGTRYREHLLSHFGADNSDLRLMRPEFLGGGSVPLQINAVPNTSARKAADSPTVKDVFPAGLTGYGMVTGSNGFTRTFKEWGYILGLASVRSDLTYSQGLDKLWTRSTRYDYAYPILAGIGEQSVKDMEIYYMTADGFNEDIWGYQPRYEEYRFKNSRLTGLMNVDAAGTLSSWHLSEDFSARPSLSAAFIVGNTATPLDRAIQIPAEPHFNADFYFKLICARPLPLNGIPGLTRL